MKKIYSIITLAAATLTASAVTPTPIPVPVAPTTAAPQLKGMSKQVSRLNFNGKLNHVAKPVTYYDSEETTPEEEIWTSVGTCKLTASFLEIFGIPTPTYEVEVEETPIEGGRKFRCLPFTSDQSPFATLFGYEDFDTENYMVFYAMEDGKNYFENFTAYDAIPFSQYVAEDGWPEPEGGYKYATFDGYTWSVPAGGVLCDLTATGNQGWYYGNYQSPLTIAFPGAKDYSTILHTWVCGEDVPGGLPEGQCQQFIFSGSEEAAYVKFGYRPGYWTFSTKSADFIAENGTEVSAGTTWSCGITNDTESGIYTAYVATFDEEDNCRDVKSSYFFVLDDDQENWAKGGKATWNESLYSNAYNEWASQQLYMDYEEHKSLPGYFRLVNPYAAAMTPEGKSLHSPCESHNHYIYIDATIPDQVKILPSVTGASFDGRSVIASNGYLFERNNDPSVIKDNGYYGTYEDNKIVIPGSDVLFGEKGYNDGTFLTLNAPFEVTFEPEIPVTGITFESAEVTVIEGRTVAMTPTLEPANSNAALTWTSTNTEVATVNPNGVVTAVTPGEATIIASYGEIFAECKVVVVPKPVLTMGIVVPVGNTVTLGVTIDNPLMTDEVVTWTSSDETVAKVSTGGSVTGVKEGSAQITATYADETATTNVLVVEEENALMNEITAAKNSKKYDLQGRAASKEAKGVMIVTQGQKAEKVIVK